MSAPAPPTAPAPPARPAMTQEARDEHGHVTYDRGILDKFATLRFVEDHHNALIFGPLGMGKLTS